ncbi:MAG TPA: glycosyltransferase family 4 protein [Vicinamibacteria bacterium]
MSTTVLYLNLYGTIGGAERALLELLDELDRTRFTPVVALGEDGPLAAELAARQIATAVVPLPAPPLHRLAWPPTLARLARAGWRLRRLARAHGARILHCGDVLGLALLVAARPAGARIVYQLNYLGGAPRRWALACLAVPTVDRLLAVSARQPSRLGPVPRLLSGRTSVVPPGIRAAAFEDGDPRTLRRALGVAEDAPLVGLVARYDSWKGHHVFLEAAARIGSRRPDVRFVMVGGSLNGGQLPHVERCREAVRARRQQLGLEQAVAVLDHRADVPAVLAGLDVLVCPSEDEPFGMIVLEALAAGTPVVASDSGGPVEILEAGRSGLLFRTGDAEALGEAVLQLLGDPHLGPRLADEGRRRVRSAFSSGRYAREVEAVYASLV